jgi:outer membrane biosynthesis protein TonB
VSLRLTLLGLLALLLLLAPVAAAQEPPTDEAAVEQPVVAEEPVAEEPVAEQPVAEEPVAEQPVEELPVADEPVTEQPVAEQPVAEEPPPPEHSVVEARNDSVVFQLVWQVQEGCRTHCNRTTQLQDSVQRSDTSQDAAAVGPDSATSQNRSTTIQLLWQEQLGCISFCFDTTQTQQASQWAGTEQSASALGQAITAALNLSDTFQFAWQYQESCLLECHGTVVSQELDQQAATTQQSDAESSAGDGGRDGFLGWLTALAENLGATIQMIFQHQQAACLEYCDGTSLTQQALQEAAVEQSARIGEADGPPPPAAAAPPPAANAPPAAAPAPAPAAAVARVEAERQSAAIPRDIDLKRRPIHRRTPAPKMDPDAATGFTTQPPQSPPRTPATEPGATQRRTEAPASQTPARAFHTAGGDGSPAPSPIPGTVLALLALFAAICAQTAYLFGRTDLLHRPEPRLRVELAPGPRRNP